jgi:hypothetical protein
VASPLTRYLSPVACLYCALSHFRGRHEQILNWKLKPWVDSVLRGDSAVQDRTMADPVVACNSVPPPFAAFRGHAEVLALHKTLSNLAERCGQSGVLTYLPFFLSACRFGAKTPHVLLLPDSAGELEAAVLLYEYGLGAASSGIFVPSDHCGERTVIAPEPLRSMLAWQAAEFLLHRGAHLVFLTLRNGDFTSADSPVSRYIQLTSRTCATRCRIALRTLPIESTFDATIARMGSHTRRNLRHYRRLAESELGATFVPEANPSESDFLELNRRSLYPIITWVARWRFHRGRTLPGRIFAGLRAQDGRWLSMIGGRRSEGTTYIDWQMNLKGFPALSIGTALRAYLLEHEIARGTHMLTFEDGTPHAMNKAFIPENVSDLVLARRSLSPNMLRTIAARMNLKRNVLAGTILSETLDWHCPNLQALRQPPSVNL